jgi:hypothetical protein
MAMSVADALEFLEIGYSLQDPIIYRGQEIYVGELENAEILMGDVIGYPASYLHITYWTHGGKKVKGSLYSMVKDRISPFFPDCKMTK